MKTSIKILFTLILFSFISPANAQLVDNGDGTITDYLTHLMWIKDPLSSNQLNWQDAGTWVSDLQTGGHTDWRLPGNQGMEVINLFSYYNGMRGEGPFENIIADNMVWTSSTDLVTGEPYAVKIVSLDSYHFDPSSQFFAWAVRDIPASETIDIDLWIKDWWKDKGIEPSSRSGQSWDIYIENDYDSKIDLPKQYDVPGINTSIHNRVYVYVRNNSDAYVQAKVNLYVHTDEADLFSSPHMQSTQKSAYIHPNSRKLVSFDNNNQPQNYDILFHTLYACTENNLCDFIGAAVHNELDPVLDFLNNPPYDPKSDNNVASVSLNFLDNNMEGKNPHLAWKWNFRFGWIALALVAVAVLWSLERYLIRPSYRAYFKKHKDD